MISSKWDQNQDNNNALLVQEGIVEGTSCDVISYDRQTQINKPKNGLWRLVLLMINTASTVKIIISVI